jgi:hypothetical protein
MGQYDSDAIPGKGDTTPTVKMPYPKETGATTLIKEPEGDSGLAKPCKTEAKGNRFA